MPTNLLTRGGLWPRPGVERALLNHPATMRIRRTLLVTVLASCAIANTASAQLVSTTIRSLTGTVACTLSSLAASPKLDAEVQTWVRSGGRGTVRVIVSTSSGLLGTLETSLSALGVPLVTDLTSINAVVVDVNVAQLSTLACLNIVGTISVDAVVGGTDAAVAAAPYSVRSTLGVPASTPTGASVGVAVIDSGIAPSGDLGNRITAFIDFTNGAKPTAPYDDFGHGTHVAGLIAGNASLAGGADYRGVAPGAALVGMKVLDANGGGRTSDVIRAIQYATAQRAKLGIQVINLSLGHPVYESAARDPLVRAVESASQAGLVVVVAAGNLGYDASTGQTGYGGITSPGDAPSAITVGAVMTKDTTTRSDDEVAPYSSRGPTWYDGLSKPDLVAPGHNLVSDAAPGSTLYTQYPQFRVGTNYLRLSGTSMAAGVVSGAVALVIEANKAAHPSGPGLTPNAVKAILEYSSIRMHDPSGAEYDDLTQGAGALNASGAIQLARAIDTSVAVGSYWWTTPVQPSTTIGAQNYTWSEHIVWGTHIVWGSSIDTNESAWGTGATWGGSTTWGSHIVWGNDIVWNSPQTWATHIVWGSSYIGATCSDGTVTYGTAVDPPSTVWGNLANASTQQP